jgi:hypothetical protein
VHGSVFNDENHETPARVETVKHGETFASRENRAFAKKPGFNRPSGWRREPTEKVPLAG